MRDDLKYAQFTGALTAMTRFLVEDLGKAVVMIDDDDNWKVKQFKATIDHAKQVLIDVEEERDFSQQVSNS